MLVVRTLVAGFLLGLPGCTGTAVVVGWKVWNGQRDQSHQTERLADAVSKNTQAIRDLVEHQRKVSDEQIAAINLKLAQIESAGILPKAEHRIEKIEAAVNELSNELRKTAPAEVLRELKELRQEIDSGKNVTRAGPDK